MFMSFTDNNQRFSFNGDYNLTFDQKKVVFEAVQEFFKESGWFS